MSIPSEYLPHDAAWWCASGPRSIECTCKCGEMKLPRDLCALMRLHPEDASITTGDEGAECTIYPAEIIPIGTSIKRDKYELHRFTSHYSCSCPGWKFQDVNVRNRTCEHLCEALGEEYERMRIGNTSNMYEILAMQKSYPMDQGQSFLKPLRSPETTPSKRVKWSTVSDVSHIPLSSEEIRVTTDDGSSMTMGWREKKLFVLLANSWPDSQSRDQKITSDPTGWWISEKLDGVRAIWDGKSLWSRNGRLWAAPSWFTNCSYLRTNEVLPVSIPLDGELWIDRGLFELTSSICRSKVCVTD